MATIVGDVKGLQQRHHQPRFQGPVCKSGTGTLGRVCGDLGLGDAIRGTWGHQEWDAGTCGTFTRDVKYSDAGDAGTLIIIANGRR